jgi:protein-arginine kinase activator protein McsA
MMENDKNNLVESPEFDEHANEQRYFAVKEHELIEEMRLDFHKAEAARRARQMATCPKCLGTFEKYEFMGFVLERCGSCEGIWSKKGDLAGILRQQARGPLARFLDRCFPK